MQSHVEPGVCSLFQALEVWENYQGFRLRKEGVPDVPHVRDLRGVIDREGAAIGVLIAMEPITKPMKTEAASAGFYESLEWGKFPRLQIYTVEELLAGATIKYPQTRANVTFKKAAKHEGPVSKVGTLNFDVED